MLLFICSRWTSIPIIQLSRTCLDFLNIGHQSVTAVISGNQCNSGQLKVRLWGWHKPVFNHREQNCRPAFYPKKKKRINFFLTLSILDIWYKEKAKGRRTGWMKKKIQELKRKPWGVALQNVKENREGPHNGPRRQSWSFFHYYKNQITSSNGVNKLV